MMRDVIFILLYILTEFLNYILGYAVVFGVKLTKTKSRWVATLIAVLVFHFILFLIFGLEVSFHASIISMILIPFILLRTTEMKNFLLYPFIVIGVSIIGVCVSFVVAIILGLPEYRVIDEMTIICQSISVLLMVLIIGYRKLRNVESYEINLNWKQYVILYAVAISLFLLLAPIQSLSNVNDNYSELNVIGLAASIACIVLVIVAIWQAVLSTKEQLLQERNMVNEKYIELQKEYYDQLINQDENIRRFRHDMNSHIQVIKALCDNGDKSELKDYLEAIIKESAVNDVKSYTGNKIVDAIIRKMMSESDEKQIKTEIKGRLPEKTKIQEFDLCTLVSNLFKNAIEACEKIEDVEKRFIYIEIGVYNFQFYMLIKNSIDKGIDIKDNQLLTTKKDYRNHGIGTRNVQSVVKKYNGMIEFYCQDGWFIAEVNI